MFLMFLLINVNQIHEKTKLFYFLHQSRGLIPGLALE
jgi:hypothetical protein